MTGVRLRALVLGVVASTLASGCGSTVELDVPTAEVAEGGDHGLTVPPSAGADDVGSGAVATDPWPEVADGSTTPGDAPFAAGEVAPPGQTGDDGGTAPSGAGTGAAGSDTGKRPVAAGTRGVDDERILIGFAYSEDTGEANSALGAEGSSGDPERNYRALLEHFNARGGAGGRDIVPVYHRWNVTSTQSFSAQEQAACATFTEDNQVFAATATGIVGLSDGTLISCLHAAGTPVIGSAGLSSNDDATFERLPHFVETNTLTLDAIAELWPGGLAEGGYFEPRGPATPAKVGLLTYDTERMRRTTTESLRPAMAAVAQEFAEEVYVRQPASLSEVGSMSAEVQNAVLRFNSQGITHVMIQDSGNALLTFVFLNSAEGQSYRPRYGLTSNNGGQSIVEQAPAAQYADARMVGWFPLFDVPASEFGEAPGAAQRECERIYEEAGITFPDRNARLVGYIQCDEVRSVIAAVEAGSGLLSQSSLVPSFVGAVGGFESVLVGPTALSQDRHYGVARHRLAAFSEDCTCFRYTTPWRRTP